MRFTIRRSPLFALHLLLLFGAPASRRYVELNGDSLVVRCGWLCHHRLALDQIKDVSVVSGPTPVGPGWRSGGLGGSYGATFYSDGVIGLAFSQQNVVEVRLKQSQRVRVLLLRVSCEQLTLSLEEPEAFVEAVAKAGVEVRQALAT